MDFEVLINDSFVNISDDESLHPVENKRVLSLLNDFEDGQWRYRKFQNFIWDNIAETALSFEERKCLVDQSHSILTAAAQNLRLTDKEKDIGKGSELAEIVLYGVMKHHYKALPVVPKIFYKQNSQDNAKGADGVHIVIENGDFSLWFGEAKFYTSIEDARLSSIVDSVGNSLKTDKLKKENSIITNVSDLDGLVEDEGIKKEIKSALSNKESIDYLKPRIHIPIFILHECEFTAQCNRMSDDYRNSVIEYHRARANSYFKKQIKVIGNLFGYGDVKFHIILFPVPSKDEIVNKFVKNVEHYKGQ
ncbi:HamA C-terminal domain-containing protein [Halomonas halodenitrificans]|uniref:HamA C-terminal domain-containing protein n=1 Tax=Halomonas halodenitrificans TaxID=28252 RepID=UPI000A019D19|nr:DUF1837 domain-containing protein [Halomonas halodenitrificans]